MKLIYTIYIDLSLSLYFISTVYACWKVVYLNGIARHICDLFILILPKSSLFMCSLSNKEV